MGTDLSDASATEERWGSPKVRDFRVAALSTGFNECPSA